MTIRLMLFAHLQDLFGSPDAFVELPAHATVHDLANLMQQKDMRLAGLTNYARVAVNSQWAKTDHELCDGDEVAFIPPSSGG